MRQNTSSILVPFLGYLMGVLAFCDTACIICEFENGFRQVLGIQSHRKECFWNISFYLVLNVVQSFNFSAMAFDRLYALSVPMR
ncbi:hypothetical protein L596_026498 [Steinernema carpocapsae]|uniref:Uncharacterized protein n=1 Tax=Steinernema carpocapsae TaxID=34508 RepID=A0A4U5M1K2_STECR|nr:hypothetical protein L596_026498 [Steinernema carpocapsae]